MATSHRASHKRSVLPSTRLGRSEIAPSHRAKLANTISTVDSALYSLSQLPAHTDSIQFIRTATATIEMAASPISIATSLDHYGRRPFHGSHLGADGSNGLKIQLYSLLPSTAPPCPRLQISSYEEPCHPYHV